MISDQVLLAEYPRGHHVVVRLRVVKIGNKHYLDLRKHYWDEATQVYLPSKNGANIHLADLPHFAKVIAELEQELSPQLSSESPEPSRSQNSAPSDHPESAT